MNNPLISVITVCFNEVKGIERTLQSVINQTYQKLEYIVIDGASNDGTVEIIKHYENKLTHFISEPDSGIYNAMNKGIGLAKGEFVCFVNGGDAFYESSTLQKCIPFTFEYDVVYGNISDFSNNIQKIENFSLPLLFLKNIPHQGTLIRKDLFDLLGYYDETLKIASDYKFWINVALNGAGRFVHSSFSHTYFDRTGVSSTQRDLMSVEINSIRNGYPVIMDLIKKFQKYEKALNTINKSRVLRFLFSLLPKKYTKETVGRIED